MEEVRRREEKRKKEQRGKKSKREGVSVVGTGKSKSEERDRLIEEDTIYKYTNFLSFFFFSFFFYFFFIFFILMNVHLIINKISLNGKHKKMSKLSPIMNECLNPLPQSNFSSQNL